MKYLTIAPDGWEEITYAYDLHAGKDVILIHKELDRLRKKGVKAVIVKWDTRGTGKHTQRTEDWKTAQESVWGSIWII